MTKERLSAAKVVVPPPLIFFVAITLGIVMQKWLFALDFPSVLMSMRLPVMLLCGFLALLLITDSLWRFFKTRQNPEPWKPTPSLIITGAYHFTRNPMYLAMTLVQCLLGFYWFNSWIVLMIPVAMTAVYYFAIKPEEHYLSMRFGKAYASYCRSVRRWV